MDNEIEETPLIVLARTMARLILLNDPPAASIRRCEN